MPRLRLVGNPNQHIETFPTKQIKRVRILHRADGYSVQFGVAAERQIEHEYTGSVVGIDMGLKVFSTDSDGNTIENPRHYRKAEKKLKRLHRQVSRKHKKSQNRRRARQRLAKASRDACNGSVKISPERWRTRLSRLTRLFAYEHLQIRNMVKNRKLAKSIHDAAWGQFLSLVKAYGIMHDVPIIAVPPQYTSQDCSGCGERVKKTLSTRTHLCPSCGLVLDRDENAAINILAKAAREYPGAQGNP